MHVGIGTACVHFPLLLLNSRLLDAKRAPRSPGHATKINVVFDTVAVSLRAKSTTLAATSPTRICRHAFAVGATIATLYADVHMA